MKRTICAILAVSMSMMMFAGCGSKAANSSPAAQASAGEAQASSWTPSQNVNWIVTSGAGGGSDIFTRMITDTMTTEKICDRTFLVTNKTDGGGEIGRASVSQTRKGNEADHTLLTFNSGDLMPMVKNTPNRIENFTPLAVMAVDKQLLFKGEKSKYADFKSAIAAAKSGTPVVIGGSKGDDIATYEKLIAEIGVTEKQMPYITYDSTGDAITAILGSHVDFVISKPAASSQYVEAKRMTPVLALSKERFTGLLADAPKLSEIGNYKDVEVPVWRAVVGPKNMSPEAAAYWSAALKKVSDSDKWKQSYIAKNLLISNYMDLKETSSYMAQFQKDYMAQENIK